MALPPALADQLIAADYIGADFPRCQVTSRIWLTRAPKSGDILELWRHPSRAVTTTWGALWQALRARIPSENYFPGAPVSSVLKDDAQAAVLRQDGTLTRHTLVAGADGHRSLVRAQVDSEAAPAYAGYSLWRGTVDPQILSDPALVMDLLDNAYVTVVFPGGHAVFYPIPDAAGHSCSPHLINWVLYAAPARGGDSPDMLPFVHDLASRHLPHAWSEVVHRSDAARMAVHPVYDLPLTRYTRFPFFLAGDASTIARPHAASGAAKALGDAMEFERLLASGGASCWEEVLDLYNRARVPRGNQLVDVGRRIGQHQVAQTPDWPTMQPCDMRTLTQKTLAGRKHYLYDGTTTP
ncbi:FAD-dependent monooxygenase [Streptomyces sp. NPDC007205]|uniref:FAD-dependent monooxygenase n=1 Tax=Streptomyces sp. NPDC007205 TaxID=3154316 RepID=UPI0033CABE86